MASDEMSRDDMLVLVRALPDGAFDGHTDFAKLTPEER
jgi:hypothetical protein